ELAGEETNNPAPQLPFPPLVELAITPLKMAPDLVRLRLSIGASAPAGLESVQIFGDGHRIRDIDSKQFKDNRANIDIDVLPQARWLAAKAVDLSCYESIPATVPLLAKVKKTGARGRLFVLAVGTDQYTDHDLLPLNAAHDAKTFSDMVQS